MNGEVNEDQTLTEIDEEVDDIADEENQNADDSSDESDSNDEEDQYSDLDSEEEESSSHSSSDVEDDNMDGDPDIFVADYAFVQQEEEISNDDPYCFLSVDLPNTVKQALNSGEEAGWEEAIISEVKAHISNGTFSVANTPKGVSTIGSRLVFAKKHNSDGSLQRFKARWVAQGFSQVPGVHYQETYSPTPNLCVFRMLLVYAVQHDLDLKQMDVHTAFLIPELPAEEVIYMRVPPGLHPFLMKCGIDMKAGQSLKLNKCIYGLKQASKYWNKKLVAVLSKLGFKQVPEEPCLFMKSTPGSPPVFILIWVDDLLMAGTTKALNVVTKLLKKALPMKDLGYPSLFTGVAIEKNAKGLFLSQKL